MQCHKQKIKDLAVYFEMSASLQIQINSIWICESDYQYPIKSYFLSSLQAYLLVGWLDVNFMEEHMSIVQNWMREQEG